MKHKRPIQAPLKIWKAGRREMKAMATPASVPNMAARGVYLRMVGPVTTPNSTTMPTINAQMRPSRQARTESFVAMYAGIMTRKTTINICGTLGP